MSNYWNGLEVLGAVKPKPTAAKAPTKRPGAVPGGGPSITKSSAHPTMPASATTSATKGPTGKQVGAAADKHAKAAQRAISVGNKIAKKHGKSKSKTSGKTQKLGAKLAALGQKHVKKAADTKKLAGKVAAGNVAKHVAAATGQVKVHGDGFDSPPQPSADAVAAANAAIMAMNNALYSAFAAGEVNAAADAGQCADTVQSLLDQLSALPGNAATGPTASQVSTSPGSQAGIRQAGTPFTGIGTTILGFFSNVIFGDSTASLISAGNDLLTRCQAIVDKADSLTSTTPGFSSGSAYIAPPVDNTTQLKNDVTAWQTKVQQALGIAPTIAEWGANTPYTKGQIVDSSGNAYKCLVAGTSGTTAPTDTGGLSAIVDGTVRWSYIGPTQVAAGTSGAWMPNTAYTAGMTVTNGGNSYQCVTAGTSGSDSGPTATTGMVTDGSVTWAALGGASSQWRPNTPYTMGAQVSNGANTYQCIVAGTSAAGGTGPSATSGTITDGTVQWVYMGAITAPAPGSQWMPNTNYPAGSQVMNFNNGYQAMTGGMSGSSGGPTSTSGQLITDGTVQWLYVNLNQQQQQGFDPGTGGGGGGGGYGDSGGGGDSGGDGSYDDGSSSAVQEFRQSGGQYDPFSDQGGGADDGSYADNAADLESGQTVSDDYNVMPGGDGSDMDDNSLNASPDASSLDEDMIGLSGTTSDDSNSLDFADDSNSLDVSGFEWRDMDTMIGALFPTEEFNDLTTGYQVQITDEEPDFERGHGSAHRGAAYLQSVDYPPWGASSGQEGGFMRPKNKIDVLGDYSRGLDVLGATKPKTPPRAGFKIAKTPKGRSYTALVVNKTPSHLKTIQNALMAGQRAQQVGSKLMSAAHKVAAKAKTAVKTTAMRGLAAHPVHPKLKAGALAKLAADTVRVGKATSASGASHKKKLDHTNKALAAGAKALAQRMRVAKTAVHGLVEEDVVSGEHSIAATVCGQDPNAMALSAATGATDPNTGLPIDPTQGASTDVTNADGVASGVGPAPTAKSVLASYVFTPDPGAAKDDTAYDSTGAAGAPTPDGAVYFDGAQDPLANNSVGSFNRVYKGGDGLYWGHTEDVWGWDIKMGSLDLDTSLANAIQHLSNPSNFRDVNRGGGDPSKVTAITSADPSTQSDVNALSIALGFGPLVGVPGTNLASARYDPGTDSYFWYYNKAPSAAKGATDALLVSQAVTDWKTQVATAMQNAAAQAQQDALDAQQADQDAKDQAASDAQNQRDIDAQQAADDAAARQQQTQDESQARQQAAQADIDIKTAQAQAESDRADAATQADIEQKAAETAAQLAPQDQGDGSDQQGSDVPAAQDDGSDMDADVDSGTMSMAQGNETNALDVAEQLNDSMNMDNDVMGVDQIIYGYMRGSDRMRARKHERRG